MIRKMINEVLAGWSLLTWGGWVPPGDTCPPQALEDDCPSAPALASIGLEADH